jgi:hypothetical protein
LLRRLQDELSVEESVRRRGGGEEEGGIGGLEERLKRVKEFESVDGSGTRAVKVEEQPDLGQAPRVVELEEFQQARARRRKGRESDDDSESGESEESKDSDDEDSEEED